MSRIRLLLVGAALMLGAARADAQGYVLVVNSANATTRVTRDRANAIFMKRVLRWDDGTPMVPVNLDRSSPTREAFSRAVHGKAATAVENYWQQQIFSGREAPPTVRATDAEVVAFVRSNAGAVGYISSAAAAGSDVKVIDVR